jgi:hypothetical protein
MAGRVREIGAAFVRLFAKSDTLEQDLDRAEQAVKESADRMEAEAKGIGAGFGVAGQKIEDSTANVRKFAGAIGAAVGVVTSMLGVIAAIGAAIAGLVVAWRKFQDLLDISDESATELSRTIRQLRAEVAELRGESTEGIAGDSDAIEAASRATIEARMALREARRELEETVRNAMGDVSSISPLTLARLEDAISQARRDVTQAEEAEALTREKQRLQRRKDEEDEVAKYRNLQMENEADRRLQMYRELEEQREQARMEAEKKSGRADAERERDRKIEQLVKSLNDNTRALEDNTKVSRGAFGFDVNTLDRLAAAIEGSA